MKAMILAAGLGTRLQPYSDHTPKSLFCVSNRPLLQNMITNLIDAGCEAVIINTHHLRTICIKKSNPLSRDNTLPSPFNCGMNPRFLEPAVPSEMLQISGTIAPLW
jgi:molybdopterin-guanine dinucleotide biosynthesis protein A